MIFHESYGEVSRAQLAAYRKHNVSPMDHDILVERYSNDPSMIVLVIKTMVKTFGHFDSWRV